MYNKPDQSFDSILNKFKRNIYGSTKGILRHELLLTHLSQNLDLQGRKLNVLDAGAGTGIMSLELLNLGHKVTINDISEQAIEDVKQQLTETPNVEYVIGPLQDIPAEGQFDLVVCHAVLEWLESPKQALQHILPLLAEQGVLSLSFFNKHAHRFGNLLYGNFDYVARDMRHKNTVRLNPNNALVPEEILAFLQELNLQISFCAGIRCFHDYLFDRSKQQEDYQQLKQMELKYGVQAPYKWLGKYFHIIAHKNDFSSTSPSRES